MSLYKTLKRTGEYTYKTTLNTKESVGTSDPTHKAMKALITRKVGMTSTIAEDGTTQAVTLLSASPCVVTQVKTVETDGYTAVQLGLKIPRRSAKPKPVTLKNRASPLKLFANSASTKSKKASQLAQV